MQQMSALSQQQVYRYPFESKLVREGSAQALQLATYTDEASESPYFFQGLLLNPRRTAVLLRALMHIVQARFHVPAAMLERILRESDPVVTSHESKLRFEGFSACCGVYVRVDLLDEALRGETLGRGTTNVDFNQPMLNALARVRQGDAVKLAVGADRVVLEKQDNEVIEKKVKLPVRWLKGFVEVQAVQSRMKLIHEINAIQALRFLRSLPRMATHRRQTWVTRSGLGLRLSQVDTRDGVRVGGLERLRVLEDLARDAESMQVYSDELTGASAWVLTFSDCRFHLVISPEVWRGFSGEGQALASLATAQKDAIPGVRAALVWQAVVDRDDIAKSTGYSADEIEGALKALGSRGLVGYDLSQSNYFHREMPFDLSQVEKLQPRLISARKLIDQNHVRVGRKTKSTVEVIVKSTDTEHRAVLAGSSSPEWKCTCPWYAKHQNSRGPCKHILAAQILLEESEP